MLKKRPKTEEKGKNIEKKLRRRVMAWVMVAAALMLIGGTYAWYKSIEREAESKTASVMEPYYLTLLNPSETDVLQLSIGSLMPGRTKQVVFCVSNKKNEESINMGGADFDYSIELIHTDNLALQYSIYELEESDEENAGVVAEDTVTVDGVPTAKRTYWSVKTPGTPLEGMDVSAVRHVETELTGDEINSGTYISYEAEDDTFHLSSTNGGYDSQYFLLEIDWEESALTNFEKYEKETDMIYILVKALQPEPSKKEATP